MKEKLMDEISRAIAKKFGSSCIAEFFEIVKDGNAVVPTAVISVPYMTPCLAVHIGSLLQGLEEGKDSLESAAQEVAAVCEGLRDISSRADVIATPCKGELLRRAAYHLVNTERNKRKLAECPHKAVLDLSAVYMATVKDNGHGTAGILIDNGICERIGISEAELDNAAGLHTDFSGFRTQPAASAFPGLPDGIGADPGCLWALKNRTKDEGASILLYPQYFGKLARKLGSDLYVAALSRRDGVIAAPVNSVTGPDTLRKAADRINSARPAQEEPLSRNVYRYRHRAGKWEIIGS